MFIWDTWWGMGGGGHSRSLKFTHTAHMCGQPKQVGGTKSWWTWKLISFESWGNQSVELTKIEEECKYFFYPLTLAVAWIHVPVLALWQHCWKCCFFKQIYSTGKKFEPNPFKQGWEQSNLPLKYRLWSENKTWSHSVYLFLWSSAALFSFARALSEKLTLTFRIPQEV